MAHPPLSAMRSLLGGTAVMLVLGVLALGNPPRFAMAQSVPSGETRRVNVPYLGPAPPAADFVPALFWLGQVGMTSNYADVRVWHFDEYLEVVLHIADRLLWYDPSATPATIDSNDAVSLYLDVSGSPGAVPEAMTYRFIGQLMTGKAVFVGNGSTWTVASAPFTVATSWRGNYPNDTVWDMGWLVEFRIPFESLGLQAPPATGTIWRLGVALHDRDDQAASAIADQVWPETLEGLRPDSWGQLRFGRPVYSAPTAVVTGTTTVRHGLNGAEVPDAAVGGHTICGDPMDAWIEWGNANYAGYTQFNIQNQWDISDFMCFSKYYVTFPLAGIPAGKSVVSARVLLDRFGNAGYGPGDAKPSAVNALTISENWAESTITWNNAPYAAENVSVTWVHPVDDSHPPGKYEWDVSYAVAEAYKYGRPLRLVFYSTDGDYHSGKYFWTSDSEDWGGTVRPTLEVQWGEGGSPPAKPTGLRIIR